MTASDNAAVEEGAGPQVKVARLLAEYGLSELGDELERRWTADEPARKSLRELAALFNHRLLASALADAGVQTLDGEVENIYRLLTAEDVSSAGRTRVRRRLEQDGVDVAQLESDFVSYQAIRTYLTDYRDAEYTTDTSDRLEQDAQSIQQLQSRLDTVTESKLERLRDAGHLSLGSFRVIIDPTVVCTDCGSRLSVADLLDDQQCNCPVD